jgi:Uma2 family endonuclease
MTAVPKYQYTLEDYIELEKTSEEKWEFFEGNVWNMAGASPKHEKLSVNVSSSLLNSIKKNKRNCSVFGSNLRVKVPVYEPYRYPDVTVICGTPIYEDLYGLKVAVNPLLIVEVLSDSTESFDRGHKFIYYKSISSFKEYLLISQTEILVTLYTKQDNFNWIRQDFNSLTDKVLLPFSECEITLEDIYFDIEF